MASAISCFEVVMQRATRVIAKLSLARGPRPGITLDRASVSVAELRWRRMMVCHSSSVARGDIRRWGCLGPR